MSFGQNACDSRFPAVIALFTGRFVHLRQIAGAFFFFINRLIPQPQSKTGSISCADARKFFVFRNCNRDRKHIRLELHQIFVFSRTAVYPDLGDRQTGLLLHQQNKICDLIRNAFFRRLYDFGFSVDGSKLYKFRADGLILATPAGSTAYSLSAGGPVVDPESECVIFTPICPHALFNRSTLFRADKTITVSTDSDYSGEVYLTIDGGAPIRIHKTDTVSVSRSTYYTELIQTDDRNFYDIVDSKFMQSRN